MTKKIYFGLACLLGAHLLVLMNLRFTPWPEMLAFPYLFNHGYVLYKDFIMPYPPFLVLVLSAVYKVFGYKILVLKAFTWGLVLLSDVFIYKIAKSLTKKEIFSLFAVALFVLTQPFLDGNMLWFDTFLVLPVLLSVYFLLKKESPRNFLLSGLFLAIAAFSKQTAFAYILAALIFVLMRTKNRFKNIVLLLMPTFVFGAIFLSYLFITRSFFDFLNWNLVFPFKYWGSYPSYVQFKLGRMDWLIVAGMVAAVAFVFKKQKLIFLMFLAGLLAVYPRLSYYHLAVAVAFWAICLAALLNRYFKNRFVQISFLVFLFLFFWYRAGNVLAWDWRGDDRFYSGTDIEVAQDIDSNFGSDARVYLANIHSGVYVYAQALPPKPWYDNYGWYWEVPDQQQKAVNLWSKNPPTAIYWKDELSGEWYLPGVYRPEIVYKWVENNYVKEKQISSGVWLWRKK